MNPYVDLWTDQRIELLKVGLAAGTSAAVLAEEINAKTGSSFSRNAIIGKSRRLQVQKSPKPLVTKARKSLTPKPKPPPLRRITPPDPNAFLAIGILDLEAHHCRYPSNSVPVTYCGQPSIAGASYCFRHARICFNP